MKRGLFLGKFMPLHNGHIELINFAVNQVDELVVLLCAEIREEIPGMIRLGFLNAEFKDNKKIKIKVIDYFEEEFTSSSVADDIETKKWADKILSYNFGIDVVFSSEEYGKLLAKFMKAEHVIYDLDRDITDISASQIRTAPYKYWEFIPKSVRDFYRQKIVLTGTESTGKTTIATLLSKRFNGLIVSEAGREIVESSETCTFEDLEKIAKVHTERIKDALKFDVPLLIIDTDINTTNSYAKFIFNKHIEFDESVTKLTSDATYFFLLPDCKFIQDGTRFSEANRNILSDSHLIHLENQECKHFRSVSGDFHERFSTVSKYIEKLFIKNKLI